MSHNNQSVIVHKARNNILKILKTRGYNVDDYEGFSVSEIHSLIVNNTLDLFIKGNENGIDKKVYIKFYNLEKTIRSTKYKVKRT